MMKVKKTQAATTKDRRSELFWLAFG